MRRGTFGLGRKSSSRAFFCFLMAMSSTAAAADRAGAQGETATKPGEVEVEAADEGGLIARGEALGKSPEVDVSKVMKDPEKFAEEPVIFEGTIAGVCKKKGCWMSVVPSDFDAGVRVTFKDYGFFVPLDCEGMIARMEGTFHTQEWSKEDADHLEAEGAQLIRNPDGSATELAFVATGVVLRPGKKPVEKGEEKGEEKVEEEVEPGQDRDHDDDDDDDDDL